jgi:hypothetical protein
LILEGLFFLSDIVFFGHVLDLIGQLGDAFLKVGQIHLIETDVHHQLSNSGGNSSLLFFSLPLSNVGLNLSNTLLVRSQLELQLLQMSLEIFVLNLSAVSHPSVLKSGLSLFILFSGLVVLLSASLDLLFVGCNSLSFNLCWFSVTFSNSGLDLVQGVLENLKGFLGTINLGPVLVNLVLFSNKSHAVLLSLNDDISVGSGFSVSCKRFSSISFLFINSCSKIFNNSFSLSFGNGIT